MPNVNCFPHLSVLAAALLGASLAQAATITVPPGQGTLRGAINTAASGDVLELVDGTYSDSTSLTYSGKDLTILAQPGTSPVITHRIELDSANNLVVQHVRFQDTALVSSAGGKLVLVKNTFVGNGGWSYSASATGSGGSLVMLQNDLTDANAYCYGTDSCTVIGNRFDLQGLTYAVDSQFSPEAANGELVFAGNDVTSNVTSDFTFGYSNNDARAANAFIVGNRFRTFRPVSDAAIWVRRFGNTVSILGNRFEFSLDEPYGSSLTKPNPLYISGATPVIAVNNNTFTLLSASAVQTGGTGYRVSSVRAVNIAGGSGSKRIHNNVFDYRNIDFGISASTAEGAIHIGADADIQGNAFVGMTQGAVEITGTGTITTITNNLCYQILGACPGSGTITTDPLFEDAATGDYRLAAGSPGIDAGPTSPFLLDIDGSRNDIGAHGEPFDLVQFDLQRLPSTEPFVYPLFDANRSISSSGNLSIRMIGAARQP